MAGRRAAGEGGLFQRTSGRHKGKWLARVNTGLDETGKPKRIDFMFSTQAEARAKIREVLGDLSKGREPITKSDKLADYLDEWLAERIKPNKAPNTYERYKSAVTIHIKKDPIAHLKLKEIGVRHIHDLMARRVKEKAQPATLFNIRATLSVAMQQAVRDELIYDNPVRKSECPRQLDKGIRYLNPREAKLLVAQSNDHEIGPLILTAMYTGMRLSELLGLTWDRVDFNKKTITIDQQLQRHDRAFYLAPLKTRAGRRTIPMASAVAEKLKALKGGSVLASSEVITPVPNLVFVTAARQPWHRKNVLNHINELMSKAKVPVIGFHALRHTCASILINGGADALRVQRQLGHGSVRMTLETYSHLFEERLQGNVDLIDQALS